MSPRVSLSSSTGFSPRELKRIQAIVIENQAVLLEAWREFFTD
jgi:hypothetical protein